LGTRLFYQEIMIGGGESPIFPRPNAALAHRLLYCRRKEVSMKKAIALTLAVVFFVSVFLFFPRPSAANTPADDCYDSYEVCRNRALESDQGWFRTAIMLTTCDLALGKCILTKM
jgi:hypothetical protein